MGQLRAEEATAERGWVQEDEGRTRGSPSEAVTSNLGHEPEEKREQKKKKEREREKREENKLDSNHAEGKKEAPRTTVGVL